MKQSVGIEKGGDRAERELLTSQKLLSKRGRRKINGWDEVRNKNCANQN